jgi:energy-coupling factor transporter ATP-binding protein EcfA2
MPASSIGRLALTHHRRDRLQPSASWWVRRIEVQYAIQLLRYLVTLLARRIASIFMPNVPLSPQANSIIADLLAGKGISSGRVNVGPLGEPAQHVLRYLLEHFVELSGISGAPQAKALINGLNSTQEEKTTADSGGILQLPSSPEWKLISLTATNYRGLVESGGTITFDFGGRTNLIYGPNGSGKSSLLGAVTWALTGLVTTDAHDNAADAPVYGTAEQANKKRGTWPCAATLPGGEFDPRLARCSVTVALQTVDTHHACEIRRSIPDRLEIALDGQTWRNIRSLSEIGISPLDMQLSLIAPLHLGRRPIEQTENTRSLLRLLLGYDDLTTVGKLAEQASANCTRLTTEEERKRAQAADELRGILEALRSVAPEGSALRGALTSLADGRRLKLADIQHVGNLTNDAIAECERDMANAIGLVGEVPYNLSDQLTIAVANLSSPFELSQPPEPDSEQVPSPLGAKPSPH